MTRNGDLVARMAADKAILEEEEAKAATSCCTDSGDGTIGWKDVTMEITGQVPPDPWTPPPESTGPVPGFNAEESARIRRRATHGPPPRIPADLGHNDILAYRASAEPLDDEQPDSVQLEVPDGYTCVDLSGEEYREYVYPGLSPYRIYNPRLLIQKCGGPVQHILDAEGMVHCMTFPHEGAVLRWKPIDLAKPVSF
jgi:hypothetical protein